MTLNQGQVIQNRYRVVTLLGKGGFGAVYKGWDLNLNKPVAIKENLDTSADAQHQFQHEAQILSNLSHPNLPRVTDHFLIPGMGQYLVMDFVEGNDLQTMLEQRGRLPEAQVLPWMEQVFDALAYLHTRTPPIIHRDIKPANIKITSQSQAVLVDFGISKIYDVHLKTTVGARAVTPGFSPPEQYGQGTTDARSDIYALGATMYVLLTGQEPPESVVRLASGVALTPPHLIAPGINPQVEAAILRACEPVTTHRLQSVNEFRQALKAQAFVATPPIPQQPIVQPPRSTPPIAQSRPMSQPRPIPAPAKTAGQDYGRRMLRGAAVALIGLLVTTFSYSAASSGGTYIIATGAIIGGTLDFLIGLVGWLRSSARAPYAQTGGGFWLQWLVMTIIGMAIGSAMGNSLESSRALPLPPGTAFGAAMAGVTGLAQWLVAQRPARLSFAWPIVSLGGGAIGAMLVYSLRSPLGSLQVDLAVRGAIVGTPIGVTQWLVLRSRSSHAGWWMLASAFGFGAGLYLSNVLFGFSSSAMQGAEIGVIYGGVTGLTLIRLLRHP